MWKLLFLGLVIPSLCQKLTASENDYRLLTCGRAPKASTLTGQEVKGPNAPWMAVVSINSPKGTYHDSATVISARHVIATSSTFFSAQIGPFADVTNCKNGWMELPETAVKATFGVSCARTQDCKTGFRVAAKRMFYIGECSQPGTEKGVVLIELENEFKEENDAVPACLAEPQTKVSFGENLKMYTYEQQPTPAIRGMDVKTVQCPAWIGANHFCMDKCFGHAGDGFVKFVDSQWTLVSVHTYFICQNVDLGGPDLALLSSRICDLSGICESTTLPNAYTPPEVKRSGRMLNKKQNDDLLKKCGVVKNVDDMPWLVSISEPTGTTGKATAISQRHLITTGSILFEQDLYIAGGGEFDFGDCSERQVDITSAALPLLKIQPCLKKQCDLPEIKLKRVVYIGDCDYTRRTRNTGILIIELASDLPSSTVPLCVPEDGLQIGDKVQRYGHYGSPQTLTTIFGPSFKGNGGAFGVFFDFPPGARGELGDSFVKNVNKRWTLVALDYVHQKNPKLYELNIGLFSEKICKITGVCGPKMLKRATMKALPRSKPLKPAVTYKPQVTKKVVTKPPVSKATKPRVTKAPRTLPTFQPLVPRTTNPPGVQYSLNGLPTFEPLVPRDPVVTDATNPFRAIVIVTKPSMEMRTFEPLVKPTTKAKPPVTKPPVTKVVTRAPKTTVKPIVTKPPVTKPPTTKPPATSRPVTLPPTTTPPTPTTTTTPPPPAPKEEAPEVQNQQERHQEVQSHLERQQEVENQQERHQETQSHLERQQETQSHLEREQEVQRHLEREQEVQRHQESQREYEKTQEMKQKDLEEIERDFEVQKAQQRDHIPEVADANPPAPSARGPIEDALDEVGRSVISNYFLPLLFIILFYEF